MTLSKQFVRRIFAIVIPMILFLDACGRIGFRLRQWQSFFNLFFEQ